MQGSENSIVDISALIVQQQVGNKPANPAVAERVACRAKLREAQIRFKDARAGVREAAKHLRVAKLEMVRLRKQQHQKLVEERCGKCRRHRHHEVASETANIAPSLVPLAEVQSETSSPSVVVPVLPVAPAVQPVDSTKTEAIEASLPSFEYQIQLDALIAAGHSNVKLVTRLLKQFKGNVVLTAGRLAKINENHASKLPLSAEVVEERRLAREQRLAAQAERRAVKERLREERLAKKLDANTKH